MSKETIGFIGLGLMGRAMVGCLQDAGHPVAVLGNRDRSGVEEALARGGTEADSARALAESCDIVMLCMGTSEQVESRIYGAGGVLEGAREGLVVIDFGTSLPASTQKIAADLAASGAAYLDAPLGRTPAHAAEGKLNIMAAGDKAAYDKVKPVLDTLGENVFHLGASGNGHTIKLINNFFGMTAVAAMSEAFAVAEAAGIERLALYDVMAAGPNHSPMMDFLKNYITDGEINLAFSVRNGSKDVGYYRQMASDLGLNSRMSTAADSTFREATSGGAGDIMVPELVDWMSQHLKEEPK